MATGYISQKDRYVEPAGTGPRVLPTDGSKGFTGLATCVGKPTGVPAETPGLVPMVMDTLNGILYIYVNDKWQPMGALGSDGPSIDAFGRLRVSEPQTLFDSKQIIDNGPLFWDESLESGAGISSSHSTALAATTITSTVSTAGTFTRQTFMRFNYQPGKSQLIFMTGVAGGSGTEVIKRMGMFDDDNGLFVEDNAGAVGFVRRSSTSGSPVDTKILQANWNIDKFDGHGPSGVKLDITKTQILVIDFEWLGVGRVRMGWVIDGIIYYAHEFLHANVLATVYMSTPNLPLRYQLITTANSPASTLICICSSVISEGGSEDLGLLRSSRTGAISAMSAATSYAVLGLRLKTTALGAVIKLAALSALSTAANDQAIWELVFNPTITGTFTYSDITNSPLQIALGGSKPTSSGGTVVASGFFTTSQGLSATIPNAKRLGVAIDGTRDTLVVVITPITNNITTRTALTWRELV